MENQWKRTGVIALSAVTVAAILLLALTWFRLSQQIVPDEEESAALISKTTLEFAKAVQATDLSLFHKKTSPQFQAEFTPDEFKRAFSGFVEQKINLAAVTKYTPVMSTPPAITRDGTLLLRGHYDTRPSRVVFNYDYIQSGNEWRISGINIDIVPVQ